jgi:hypothetical protein
LKHINVIENFIDDNTNKLIVEFIDNNQEIFLSHQDNRRFALRFGKDFNWKDSKEDMSLLKDLSNIFKDNIFPKVDKAMLELYNEKNLKVSNMWLSKHLPGSNILLHNDHDGGINAQFKYGAILYLNTLKDDGILQFPFLKYSYTPISNSLIIFPTHPIDFEDQFAHCVDSINSVRYSVPIWISDIEYSL